MQTMSVTEPDRTRSILERKLLMFGLRVNVLLVIIVFILQFFVLDKMAKLRHQIAEGTNDP
mgnify:CR=1